MRVEKLVELRADARTIWRALTDPELTRKYFFACEACSDWKVGSDLLYKTKHEGEEIVAVHGVIKAIEPERFLQHTCIAAGTEGQPGAETTVTYTLTPRGEVTELAVSQGEFAEDGEQDQHSDNWNLVLSGLKELVEGSSAP